MTEKLQHSEFMEQHRIPSVEQHEVDRERLAITHEYITSAINELRSEKQRKCIFMRFGINYHHDYTLKEIANEMGTSHQNVAKHIQAGLRHLRDSEKIHKIRNFFYKKG